MSAPDPRPTDEQIAALLAAADRDAPPPDRAILDRLRDQSLEAFQSATPGPATISPRKRIMVVSALRWVAAAAAVLFVGIVLANWIGLVHRPDPAPDEQFVVSDKLIEDGRIGKVTDSQGVVSVKPVMHERWSPVQPRLVLRPGDWIRTDSRGANAVAVKLVNAAGVIVGPHSTVELVKPSEVRLLAGEAEITSDAPVDLYGPDKQKMTVRGKQLVRVEKDRLVRVEHDPIWLQGFKGTTTAESIGSLVASIDGRDVPLTVGYHHVTVDIRDQIARTVIEESFVNHSPQVLEGVFHFPLPADASISGFGMWIGDQLVEADVVEKQRAREIYETILREKRDPGLLEWAGGNVFKARVFPIPALGEKRIRITYTQVLPLQGNRYRYSYALQSDLLKQHPLRDLAIDLKVNSATPIKSVTAPTHPARIAATEHSGHVEFSAQEYTPTRDFEAVIEVEGGRSAVVVIPHRRGDDGYFMVQLTPPGPAGDWDRPLVPDGEPLHLLLLADTSASMDRGQRATQAAFLATLFGALTPRDTLNVAACDVNCDWIFEKPVPATAANLTTVRDVLAKRSSLGWTDLDKAFASAMTMSAPGTHVIYVGDGIVTTGDADPVAFADRLRRTYEGKAGTFHAVAVGSTYEPAALKAIASLGGGSVRHVSGDRGPQAVALELLGEIATPALRDLKVEFTGLRTARVYPDVMPNVAVGAQQILLGRYLPEGQDQTGEIVVTGKLGDKPVRFTSKVSLKDAEQGNSFIARLWARMHLDKLLEQGTADAVKQEIIALSEEYQIITPYTSLLVLESAADRDRFAVKRRFQMRDGEKFFAAGRDNASFELRQKQMTAAGEYRTALRRSVLAQLAGLGRNARMPQRRLANLNGAIYLGDGDWSGRMAGGGGFGGRDFYFGLNTLGRRSTMDDQSLDFDSDNPVYLELLKDDKAFGDQKAEAGWELGAASTPVVINESYAELGEDDIKAPLPVLDEISGRDADSNSTSGVLMFAGSRGLKGRRAWPVADLVIPLSGLDANGQSSQLQWLGSLFPSLAPPPREFKAPKKPWPDAALALSRGLSRMEALARQKGGLVLFRQSEVFDIRRNELKSRTKRLELVAPTAWLGRTMPDGSQVLVSWCDAKEFGAYSTAFQLGRVRGSTKLDLERPALELADSSVTALHDAYAHYTPTIESIAQDRVLLVLSHKDDSDQEVRFLIDTGRHALISIERRQKGKVTGTTRFDDFVEIAGSWWARRIETLDDKGRRQSLSEQTITELPADECAKRMALELAGKDKVLFLRQPLPDVDKAKAAVTAGKATFDDEAVLTLHFAATQQWARARQHLEQCERLAAGKSGMRLLTDAFFLASRRHEEWRNRLLKQAGELAETTDADVRANDFFLAERLVTEAENTLQANETRSLVDVLQKVYRRQPTQLQAPKTWCNHQAELTYRSGQSDKALPLFKSLAVDFPRDVNLQSQYFQHLVYAGDFDAAYAWIDRILGPDAEWDAGEEATLRTYNANYLQQQGRYRELAAYLADWIKRDPEQEQPYGQYLTALIRSNQGAQAETLVGQWLREGQVTGELAGPVAARLAAAVAFTLGQGYDLYTYRVEERWHAPLAQAALFFARHDEHLSTAAKILQDGSFQSTDAARTVRKTLAGILVKEIDTLSVAQIGHFVNWVWSDSDMGRDAWQTVADRLRKRWDAEKKPKLQHQLAQPLVRILTWLGPDQVLAFLRIQCNIGPEQHRVEYVNQLFNALLSSNWSLEFEAEAFALLDKLAEADAPAGGLAIRVAALHRLTDAMLEGRYQARMKTVDHPEKLPRTELLAKQDENRRLAREGFADRLRREAVGQAKPFANWLIVERLWIDTLLGRNLKQTADECLEGLNVAPVQAKPDDDGSAVEKALDDVLRERFLVTLEYLAARKGADPALVDRLVKHIDQQLSAHPDDRQWRAEDFRLLIALDRSADLEKNLRQWTAGPDSENRWRLALGELLAEQGKISEAIKAFEAVEAADELSPGAYRSLAAWYLVDNRREQHEKALVAAFKTADEYRLSQSISMYLRPWQNPQDRPPTQFDPEVLRVFKALFEKSSAPQNYLWQVQQFYQASRDFRLLSMLVDGLVGHSAGKIYPFLQSMSGVLSEVRDEATADELAARIAQVRATAKTAVDQRALDLLELLVERRAAELQNQPGPHADKALVALERAFKGDWTPGEPSLMADFLGALGKIPQPALAKEQLRQLEMLHRDAATGSFDRLHIAQRQGETLNAYARRPEAIDQLSAALKGFEDANQGILPESANHALWILISFMENAGHYERGEALLLAQLKHPIHTQQKYRLVQRLNDLYILALQNNGAVSLGTGPTLYTALERKLFADLAAPDQNQRYSVFSEFTRFYRTAHALKIASVGADLRAFAFKRATPILKEQIVNYEQVVRDVADTVHDVAGARDAITFMLDRIEDEPDWLRFNSQDGWTQNSNKLGEWHSEVKDLGDLEARFLKPVLAELRRDLRSRTSRYRTMYDRRYNYSWAQKEAAFATVAEEVLAERKTSSASVEYVAEYLYFGLPRERRAIEILLTAHEQRTLAETGQWQLADYLHRQNRHAESIPLLLPLVELRPENLSYRTKLMHAYFRTGRQGELLALLKQTDAYFHENERWNEGPLAGLAASCLENHLYSQSVAYYEELIPLHQRTHPRRGVGNGILSSYYAGAGQAYAGLGKTKEAVDMASGGVVSWAPGQQQRKDGLEALVQVLVAAPDLAAYVAELDKQSLQSAVVRKAIGQAYVRKGDHARAIPQLALAADLQPNDEEILKALIVCYDKIGDKEGTIRQLLNAVELSRGGIKLYEQLGGRLAEQRQPAEAERAYTSVVELQPNESEGHALLAEVREKQDRWPEAIAQWQRVATIHALEPTGLLKLAAAQIHERAWDQAAATLRKLRGQNWPQRFGDVQQQVRELEKKINGR
jgi:Flp pilus assembly protein TadD/predicted Zn-dependent protease